MEIIRRRERRIRRAGARRDIAGRGGRVRIKCREERGVASMT